MAIYHYHGCGCGCNKSHIPTYTNQTNRTFNIPVPGIPGEAGSKLVNMYKITNTTNIPTIGEIPNPIGWSNVPLQTTEEYPYRWLSQGYLSADGTELIQTWSEPVLELDSSIITPIFSNNISDI